MFYKYLTDSIIVIKIITSLYSDKNCNKKEFYIFYKKNSLLRSKKFILILICSPMLLLAQNLDKIGKSSLFKLSGGVGVNSVYYNGDANREPFTYFLSGNVNLNISDVYNIPFSFSYSNTKFQTNNPFTFNRLSMHPSYKWVTTHIGDVNMSFSPYTLNGHQFTGLGADASPNEKFQISAMYGRLLKSREFDNENLNGEANYKRIGYGFKTSYKFEKATVGLIFFKATDDVSSLENQIPIENDIQPKDNTVISFNSDFNIYKNLQLKGEVALSALTEDTRINGASDHVASFLVASNPTTQYYKAFNLNLLYQIGKGSVGVGYERIDPNYKTLGGYFFNNDLENITINASQTIFKDKLSLAVNAGLQKDDLDDSKASQLNRLVTSFNATYNASEKLNISGSYSNFQSFTNIKNQFDFINGVSQIEEELDQDNIAQLSQNANVNVNYTIKESPSNTQNINVNISYQDAENQIDDVVREEDNSSFYNATSAYTVSFPENALSLSGGFNASISKLEMSTGLILGPTVTASKGFFEKKLKVNAGISYNESINDGLRQGQVANIRLGSRYVYKKQHNFSLNGLFQHRNNVNKATQNFTLTFGYNYSFGLFDSKNIRFKKRKKKEKKKRAKRERIKKPIKFSYKDSLYIGTIAEIDFKIENLLKVPIFKAIPIAIKEQMHTQRKEIATEKEPKVYKIKAIQLLKELYDTKQNLKEFNQLLYIALKEVYRSANNLDRTIERQFVMNKKEIVKHSLWNKTKEDKKLFSMKEQKEFSKMEKAVNKSHKKLLVHRWLLSELEKYKTFEQLEKDTKLFHDFREKYVYNVFKMLKMKENKNKINLYLQASIIEFFAKESESHIDKNRYELRYMDLN